MDRSGLRCVHRAVGAFPRTENASRFVDMCIVARTKRDLQKKRELARVHIGRLLSQVDATTIRGKRAFEHGGEADSSPLHDLFIY